ncbi:MAG: methyltransferase [Blastocatellia bacterium]|nr:methyltransferase [Blastocatellia bacterium]
MDVQNLPPSVQMLQMITGYWLSQAIYVAAKLNIADLLKDEPKNVDQLAQATQSNSEFLYRILRALASVGIFDEFESKTFRLTPLAECLISNTPNSVRDVAVFSGEEQYKAWGNILYSVKEGASAFQKTYGTSPFQYFVNHPEVSLLFDRSMSNVAHATHLAILAVYNFSNIETLVDVGGGKGALLKAILRANPHLKGVLFDLPHVVQDSFDEEADADLKGRFEAVGGNFFESVPSGYDAYILSTVIHDWDDESSIKILKKCREAMRDDSKLLLSEFVIPPGNQPFFGKFLDLNMMIMTIGQERTEAEYKALYESAGFNLVRIIMTPSQTSIIEGVPAV